MEARSYLQKLYTPLVGKIAIILGSIFALLALGVYLISPTMLTPQWQQKYYALFGEARYQEPPASQFAELGTPEVVCPEVDARPEWRKAQVIEGVDIAESRVCLPDNPYTVAAAVKGTNKVSMDTLSQSGLGIDAVTVENDRDNDGDPDVITVRLEVAELNGHSPDMPEAIPQYAIAPGVKPGFWVFAPKTHGMSTKTIIDPEANPLLRPPSPTLRVEEGDTIRIILENTHYFPHTIHFHGVDHSFLLDAAGHGGGHTEKVGMDGVAETSELPTMPGKSHVYEMTPRHAGTMLYHCHVNHHVHFLMGLQGMFVVEENRPNNWVQTLNIGAGHVRHPAAAVKERYNREYDMVYQDLDKELHELSRSFNDPRLLAKALHRDYDITESGEDYFLVNGKAFPYTVRETIIVVKKDDKVKIRMLNGGDQGIAIHSHGHKMTITDYDGAHHPEPAQIMRDTFWVTSGQRLDLEMQAVNDGLHSYGEGVWLIHDHKEPGVTNDGIYPGGNVAIIAYESYLSDSGLPQLHGINPGFFNANYFNKTAPVWASYDGEHMLNDVQTDGPELSRLLPLIFVVGAVLGATGFLLSSRMKKPAKEAV